MHVSYVLQKLYCSICTYINYLYPPPLCTYVAIYKFLLSMLLYNHVHIWLCDLVTVVASNYLSLQMTESLQLSVFVH